VTEDKRGQRGGERETTGDERLHERKRRERECPEVEEETH
jgi:hypothetical protein